MPEIIFSRKTNSHQVPLGMSSIIKEVDIGKNATGQGFG